MYLFDMVGIGMSTLNGMAITMFLRLKTITHALEENEVINEKNCTLGGSFHPYTSFNTTVKSQKCL